MRILSNDKNLSISKWMLSRGWCHLNSVAVFSSHAQSYSLTAHSFIREYQLIITTLDNIRRVLPQVLAIFFYHSKCMATMLHFEPSLLSDDSHGSPGYNPGYPKVHSYLETPCVTSTTITITVPHLSSTGYPPALAPSVGTDYSTLPAPLAGSTYRLLPSLGFSGATG